MRFRPSGAQYGHEKIPPPLHTLVDQPVDDGPLCLFVLTLLVADALKQRHVTPAMGVAVILLALAARYARQDYGRRAHGKAVEDLALRRLVLEGERRGWQVQCNLPSPNGGDVDALVTARGRCYVVEVKSWHGLRPSRDGVVKLNGSPVSGDPLRQCLRNAAPHSATPVLWMPTASRRAGWFTSQGVAVVHGDARTFCNRIEKWI